MITVPTLLRPQRSLVVVLTTAAFALSGCGAEQSPSDDLASTPAGASGSPSGTPAESEDPKPITVAVPIYVAGEAAGEVRLFREFQQVQGEAVSEAARLVDGGQPIDPDYRTLWPGGTVLSAEVKRKAITVNLDADAFTERPDGMSEREATLALQQMVLTLQGVVQEKYPVTFVRSSVPSATPGDEELDPESTDEVDGDETPSTLFGIDISEPVKRADWGKTLAMVNVTIPAQDSSVVGEVLDAEGVASSFEANVPWEIRRGDEVVLDGFATAEGWMDKLHPWFTSIDVSELEPGDYTFVAMTDDASEGEGDGPTEDSKEFTLR